MNITRNGFIVATMLTASYPAYARGNNTYDTMNSVTNTYSSGSAIDNTGMNSGASAMSWDSQNTYWRNNYPSRSYYNTSRGYSMYEPAYRYGVDLYNRNPGKTYDQLDQSQMSNDWNRVRGNSTLNWDDAQNAARDSYNRMHQQSSAANPNMR